MRPSQLVKRTVALVLPSALAALLAVQVYMCMSVLRLRNAYLIESLPATSDKIWDALSGGLYPYLYPSMFEHENHFRVGLRAMIDKDPIPVNMKSNSAPVSKERWQLENEQITKHYRESVLQPGFPSLTVHFLWCADGYFELNQYLTIVSILHQLRPDKIVIHYWIKPRSDPHGYWRWLEDLERDVVMLSLRRLKSAKYCSHDLSLGVTFEHFHDPHGIFILGDVILTNLTRPDVIDIINKSFSKGKGALSVPSPEKLSKSQVFVVSDAEPFHVSQGPGHTVITCPTDSDFNLAPKLNSVHCVSMQSYISPDMLFHSESRFYNLARTLMYGSAKPVEIKKASFQQIPKIVHIVLEDGSAEIGPVLYLCIKSAYVTGKVERVFVHSHQKPHGQLWDKLLFSDHLEPKFIPTSPLTNPSAVKSYLLYTLLQHGGIATRGDVVFMKPVNSISLQSSAIATLQRSQYRQKHRTLNTAILAASSGSNFIKNVLGMFYQPEPSRIAVDLDDIASHISEISPQSVLIDSQLTSHLVCQDQRCMIAGGHRLPDHAFTTKILWGNQHEQPKSLQEFLSIEGPTRTYFSKLA